MRFGGEQVRVVDIASTGGITIHPFLRHFDATFHQSGSTLFKRFLKANANCEHWLLLSDYAFNDKAEASDVVTFAFVPQPNRERFAELCSRIQAAAPVDLKHSSSVRPEFISLIKDWS